MKRGSTSSATTTSPAAPSRVTPSSVPRSLKYVLVKRAKLWEAASHEHLFFWDTPRLTTGELDDLVGCVTGEGLSLVRPAPDHMTTYLSLAIVADAVDDLAWERVRRTRFRKNFALGWRGWADLRLAVADLSRGRVTTNSQGKPLGETLQANASIDGGVAVRDARCGNASSAVRDAVRDGHRLDGAAGVSARSGGPSLPRRAPSL